MTDYAYAIYYVTTFLLAKNIMYAGLTILAVAVGVDFLKRNI